METKRAAAVKGGKYLALSESLTEELAEKYSHLVSVEQMQYPWDSLENLRCSLLDGPPSKAKNKFANIMDLLINNENLAQFRFVPDLIVQAVIYRVLFVFKNHKSVLAHLMSLCGKKNKRNSTRTSPDQGDDDNRRKKSPKIFAFPVDIKPSYSITSPPVLSACIPVQLAATLIPMPMLDDLSGLMTEGDDFDFFMDCIESEQNYAPVAPVVSNPVEQDTRSLFYGTQAAVEKAKEASAKMALLKDKRVLKKVLKAQKAAQSVVPIDIQRTSSDHICAVIPVLPLSLLNPNTLDDLSVSSDPLEDQVSVERNTYGSSGMMSFNQFFDEDTFNLLVDDDSSSLASSSMDSQSQSGGYSAVSALTSNESSPRPRAGVDPSQVNLTINPSTTKYILRDNVLCAIVPVSDPALIAAAAALHRGDVCEDGDVYQHTPGGRNMERSSSIKVETPGYNSDTDKDSCASYSDKCSLGPPLAPRSVNSAFSAPPLSMHRFNSLYADDDESAEPLAGACTQSFISVDTFESFVF
eukprot:gene31622-39062_t